VDSRDLPLFASILGSALGIRDYTGEVKAGSTVCTSTQWTSETSVVGKIAAGIGRSQAMTVSVAIVTGTETEVITYDAAEITAVWRGRNHAPAGGSSTTIIALNFAKTSYSVSSRLGATDGETTVWLSDNIVVCRVAGGEGGSVSLSLTAGVGVGSSTGMLSYNAPRLSTSPGNVMHDRSQVTVHGLALGVHDYSIAARLRGTASQRSAWLSDSSLLSLPGTAISGTRLVSVTAGILVGSLSESLSFDSGVLMQSNTTKIENSPTRGGAVLSLSGVALGAVGTSFAARSGSTSCEETSWLSASAVHCRFSAGVRHSQSVSVTVGRQAGSITNVISFDAPAIACASTLVNVINVTSAAPEVSSSTTSLLPTTTTTPTATTTPAPALNITLNVTMTTAARRLLMSSAAVECLPSQSSNVVSSELSTILVAGPNLGASDFSAAVRLGKTQIEATQWISDTFVHGLVGSGMRSTLQLSVTVGALVGSTSQLVSFSTPALSGSEVANLRLGVASAVTVNGIELARWDASVNGRVGGSACEATAWLSMTSVGCKFARGTAATMSVSFTVGQQAGSTSGVVSYDTSLIDSVISWSSYNFGMNASAVVTVGGQGFSSADTSSFSAVGRTSVEASTWISDSSVTCAAATGTGGSRQLTITAGLLVASVSEVLSYDIPSLKSITELKLMELLGSCNATDSREAVCAAAEHLLDADDTTAALVTLGVDFLHHRYSEAVSIGQTASVASVWSGTTELTCKVAAGVAGTHRSVITVGELTRSVSDAFSYHHQIVDSVDNMAASGRLLATIVGSGLGKDMYSGIGRLGLTGCEASGWTSDTSVLARFPTGVGASNRLTYTVGVRSATLLETFSFDVPVISNPDQSNLLRTFFDAVIVSASNLGNAWYTDAGRIGLSASARTQWLSEDRIRCKVSNGAGGEKSVILTVGQRVGSALGLLSFNAPTVDDGQVRNLATLQDSAAAILTIGGSRFGRQAYSQTARIGHTAAVVNLWVSDSSLTVRAASGSDLPWSGVVTVEAQFGTLSSVFSYDGPVISSVFNMSAPTVGGDRLTIFGDNFAQAVSPSVRMGLTACEVTLWSSVESVECNIAGGVQGQDLAAVLTVALQVGTLTESFSYARYDATGFNAPSADSAFIYLEGINFGVSDNTLRRTVGKVGCQSSQWISDTSILCQLNGGVVAGDVTQEDIDQTLLCRVCKDPDVLDGCNGFDIGTCDRCEACPPGSFRANCTLGGTTRGACQTCPSGTYKPFFGGANATCLPCDVCGGANANGVLFELSACTPTQNTVCQNCQPCEVGLRFGCEGDNPGVCDDTSPGIQAVLANANINLENVTTALGTVPPSAQYPQGGTASVTSSQVVTSLPGAYSDVQVIIEPATFLFFPGDATQMGMSAVDVGPSITTATMSSAGSATASSSGLLTLSNPAAPIGPFIKYRPTGATFDPPILIKIPFNESMLTGNARPAIHKFIEAQQTWTEVPGTVIIPPNIAAVYVSSFSLYTVMAVPGPVTEEIFAAPATVQMEDVATPLGDGQWVSEEAWVVRLEWSGNNGQAGGNNGGGNNGGGNNGGGNSGGGNSGGGSAADLPFDVEEIGFDIPAGTAFTLPEGFEGDLVWAVEQATLSAEMEAALNASGIDTSRLIVIKFSPSGVRFSKPVLIHVPFDPVYFADKPGARIGVFRWYPDLKQWIEKPGAQVTSPGIASVYTDIFSFWIVQESEIEEEPPSLVEPDDDLNLPVIIASIVAVTGVLILALFAAFAMRSRARVREREALEVADIEGKTGKKPDVGPDSGVVSDEFTSVEHVSALELSQQLAEQMGDSAAGTTIDPAVLSLAQQLAQSESPRIGPIDEAGAGVVDADVEFGLPVESLGIGAGTGLSQEEMASLLAGLAAAEKMNLSGVEELQGRGGSAGQGQEQGRRPKKGKKSRGAATAEAAGPSLSQAQWTRMEREVPPSHTPTEMAPVPSNLTLGALGLSLADTIGTAPPPHQQPGAGALTLEQLGLSLQDTTAVVDEGDHDALAGALERVERPDQRLQRIANTFGAGPSVRASADFVLIDDIEEQGPNRPGRDGGAA